MDETKKPSGFIRSYGMFWERHEVNWAPGSGNGDTFRLLGHIGVNKGSLQVCDFREQRGIYVLYDDHGPYYVGLANKMPLGHRLRDHTKDLHKNKWDRFSWFGFRRVLKSTNTDGTRKLAQTPAQLLTDSASTIRDVEALLIQSLGTYRTGNSQQMKFQGASKWLQVPYEDGPTYLEKLA